MKRFLYYWLLVLGVALLFAGCTNEEDARGKASNELMVNLNVATPVSFGNSRALTTENENKISNIHILAFDWDTGEMISNGYTEVDNKSNMTCRLSLAGDQNTKVALYAIANIGNPTIFDDHTLTRSDFENLYVDASYNVDNISAGTYSLHKDDMSLLANVRNETHALLVSPKLDTYHTTLNYGGMSVTLNLERLSPKIILNLYGNDINLVSYQFRNIPTFDWLLQESSNSITYGSEKNFAANTSSAEGITFYGFESLKAPNTNVTGQRDRTDENAPEGAAYLDIKGYPVSNPDKLYRYRVYLGGVNAAGVATPSEFSLLRNHDYYLNIILSDYTENDNRVLDNTLSGTITVTPWAENENHVADMKAKKEQINIGDYLCSDGSFITPEEVPTSDKTPIAIVFMTYTSIKDRENGFKRGYAMALKIADRTDWFWGPDIDIPDLPNINYSTWQEFANDLDGYSYTNSIIRFLTHDYEYSYSRFPLQALELFEEKVSAPSNTSGWFLPSTGQWYHIFVNLAGASEIPDYDYNLYGWNLDITDLENRLSVVGSDNYSPFINPPYPYATSCEYSEKRFYGIELMLGYRFTANFHKDGDYIKVRPVIAF